jgi:integrase/recombinase XerD
VTQLRKKMLEEIQRRDYSKSTARIYLHVISDFARYFRRSPDLLGPEHIRHYQVHLFRRKLSPYTIRQHTAALRFFYFKTLRRHFPAEYIPFPKYRQRLPTILSPEEVARLIDAAHNLFHRTLIMTLYSTAMRRAELCRLKVTDIDSQRMMIRIQQGKGGRDREVPLSPTLLETLRFYWRWMKPKTYLFPGTVDGCVPTFPLGWKLVPTSVPSSFYSVTPPSNTLSFTCICHTNICIQCPTHWINCRSPISTRCNGHRGYRNHEPPTA